MKRKKTKLSRKTSFVVGQSMRMSILSHVNSLAVSNYLGLSYALGNAKLDELVNSKKIGGPYASKVDVSGSNPTAARKLIQKLFTFFLGIHPRLAAIFIDVISKFNFRGNQYDVQVPTTNLGRFPFLYENLVHRNQYLVRDLDKSTIHATLDLTNLSGYEQSSKDEFEYLSKFTNALRDLLTSSIFPKLQILQLDVCVSDGKSVSTLEEKLQVQHNQAESCTYKIVTKVISAPDLPSIIQKCMKTDIQVLTHSPSDAGLATSILYPAKLVLIDKDSPLKLRTWTQVL